MLNYIKLYSEHMQVVKGLAEDLEDSKKSVAYLLIEMGMNVLLAAKKTTEDKNLVAGMVRILRAKMLEDESFMKTASLLEEYHELGSN